MAFGRPVTDDRRSGPGSRLVRGAGDPLTPAGNGSKGTTLSARGAPPGRDASDADAGRHVRALTAERVQESLGKGGVTHAAAARPP